VLRFAVPAGVVIGATVLATFLVARAGGMSLEHARTLTTLVLIVVSLAVIVILEWPLAGYRLAVVAAMAGGLVIVFAWPFARDFFALVVPTAGELVAALGVSAAAAVAIALLTRDARRSARG
jgi:cation-transporting ATPase E